MDIKSNFSVDILSENERITALNKIIHEFQVMKGAGGDELIHKRRQLLLSIWGELVLARKDPAVPTNSESESVEGKSEEPSTSLNERASPQEHDDHRTEGHPHEEPLFEENHAFLQVSHEIKDIDASSEKLTEEPLPNLELNGYHESKMEPSHNNAPADLDHKIDVEGSASKLEDLSEDYELYDPVHVDPSSLITEVTDADSLQKSFSVPSAEDQSSEPVAFVVADSDEKAEIEFVIQNLHSGEAQANYSPITIASTAESTNDVLVKIYDGQHSEQKPLIEIMDVQTDPDQIFNIGPIRDEATPERATTLVRLCLLKTGILHDVVLPEGTVVSTNAADAEELIASGTAERLLIQNDDEDDDDY